MSEKMPWATNCDCKNGNSRDWHLHSKDCPVFMRGRIKEFEAQQPAVSDLPRFSPDLWRDSDGGIGSAVMTPDSGGLWVRFSDVEAQRPAVSERAITMADMKSHALEFVRHVRWHNIRAQDTDKAYREFLSSLQANGWSPGTGRQQQPAVSDEMIDAGEAELFQGCGAATLSNGVEHICETDLREDAKRCYVAMRKAALQPGSDG